MYEVGLRLAQTPSRYLLEALLDALAWHNAGWYLEQWEARQRPPKSAAAAGVRWTPDAPAVSAESVLIRVRCSELSARPLRDEVFTVDESGDTYTVVRTLPASDEFEHRVLAK